MNGRFTKNFEVRLWGQSNETEVTFLEFGATKDSYEEYLVSPHSFNELAQKMMGSWDGSENQKQVARKYFQELVGFDRYAGISWTKEMISGELPWLPAGMRVCTFFTSTQKEFVGVGDAEDDFLFENQFVAFEALRKELTSAGDWFIVIRRHPKFLSVKHDADGRYWEKYKAFNNIIIVDPDSQVDSYALGHRSDLVAHFNSSIAIQLVYGGHRSVLTLGNAMWSKLLPGTVARSQSAISEFLETITKDWTPEMTLPWAYFRATYGKEFEFFEFESGNNGWKLINSI